VREYFTSNNTDFWDHSYNDQGLRDPSGTILGINFSIPDDNTNADGLDAIFHEDRTNSSTPFAQLLNYNGTEMNAVIVKSCFIENEYISSPDDAFAQFQHYCNIRDVMATIPSRVFIFLTSPPLNNRQDSSYKDCNNYMRHYCWDFMTNGTFTQNTTNVFVWDFNGMLMDNRSSGTNAFGLRAEYQSSTDDSHPNEQADLINAPLFVQFVLNAMAIYFDHSSVQLTTPIPPYNPPASIDGFNLLFLGGISITFIWGLIKIKKQIH